MLDPLATDDAARVWAPLERSVASGLWQDTDDSWR